MGASSREAIIQISAAIAKLREDAARIKEELKRYEVQLDRLLSGEVNPELIKQERSTPSAVGSAGDRSLNQRVVDLLDSAPSKQFTADDVYAYLPEANITSIRSGLARLADQGRINRAGRGYYASIMGSESEAPGILESAS